MKDDMLMSNTVIWR